MQWASSEVLSVLVFLLPGFVAASVFHSLTSHPKPSAFDRTIEALIFTLVAQALTLVTLLLFIERSQEWPMDWQFVLSVGVAAAIGFIAAVVSNHDLVHKPQQVAAEGVSAILVPADQVEMVEFMEDASSEDV